VGKLARRVREQDTFSANRLTTLLRLTCSFRAQVLASICLTFLYHLVKLYGNVPMDCFVGMGVNRVHSYSGRIAPGQEKPDIKHRHVVFLKKIDNRLNKRAALLNGSHVWKNHHHKRDLL
jgi:hypothetical protein